MEKIQLNSVVNFQYSLTDLEGNAIENNLQTPGGQAYLHGYKSLIVGLETALEGKQAGDQFDVSVAPELAYGLRQEDRLQRVPIKRLNKAGKLSVGQWLQVQSDQGTQIAVVKKIGLTVVDLDLNHPLAGKALKFNVSVLAVRAASEEEIAHGHVHGEGGVQH